MSDSNDSVFLKVKDRVLENELSFALYDINPASKGHMLIIPKRQFASFFDCTDEELTTLYSLLKEAKELLNDKYQPAGFNVGVNIGESAGQTVPHAHIHLIPRYEDEKLEATAHTGGSVRN